MDAKHAFELIDSYDLKDCMALLIVYAPDLHAQVVELARSGADARTILAAARERVKQAYLREDN